VKENITLRDLLTPEFLNKSQPGTTTTADTNQRYQKLKKIANGPTFNVQRNSQTIDKTFESDKPVQGVAKVSNRTTIRADGGIISPKMSKRASNIPIASSMSNEDLEAF
jgi:hypothetical protein